MLGPSCIHIRCHGPITVVLQIVVMPLLDTCSIGEVTLGGLRLLMDIGNDFAHRQPKICVNVPIDCLSDLILAIFRGFDRDAVALQPSLQEATKEALTRITRDLEVAHIPCPVMPLLVMCR